MDSLIEELRSHGTSLYRPDHPTSLLLWKAATALSTMQDREATLIRVLRDAREAIASLETEALHVYPLREELLSDIDEALGTSGLVERS